MQIELWEQTIKMSPLAIDLENKMGKITHPEFIFSKIFSELQKIGVCEPWKFAYHNDDYVVTKSGRVFSICKTLRSKSGNIIRHYRINEVFGCKTANGYLAYRVTVNSKRRHLKAHRLILSAFTGREIFDKMVNHIDGNRLNNALENLEWVTAQENVDHAVRTGLWKYEDCRKDKIFACDYPLIYYMWKHAGESKRSISKMFGVFPIKITRVIEKTEKLMEFIRENCKNKDSRYPAISKQS